MTLIPFILVVVGIILLISIRQVNEYDRRKTYRQSAAGRELLAFEISRLREMLESAEQTAENM